MLHFVIGHQHLQSTATHKRIELRNTALTLTDADQHLLFECSIVKMQLNATKLID